MTSQVTGDCMLNTIKHFKSLNRDEWRCQVKFTECKFTGQREMVQVLAAHSFILFDQMNDSNKKMNRNYLFTSVIECCSISIICAVI